MANAKVAAQVVIFNSSLNSIAIENVSSIEADVLQTKSGIYQKNNAQTYVDEQSGKLVYVFEADVHAKQEAANLKLLRRDVTIKNLFKFERNVGGIDWLKIAPYLIILAMIFMRK